MSARTLLYVLLCLVIAGMAGCTSGSRSDVPGQDGAVEDVGPVSADTAALPTTAPRRTASATRKSAARRRALSGRCRPPK